MADLTIIAKQVRPIEVIENRNRTVIVDEDVLMGQLLYGKANGRAAKARANAVSTAKPIGFATSDAKSGKPVEALYFGRLAGLDLSAINAYTTLYLSAATAGAVADTAPVGTGNVVVPVGAVNVYTNPAGTKFLFVDISASFVPVALA